MENPNDGVTPSPEPMTRPPVVELFNGFAIFLLVFLVFALGQSALLVERVLRSMPELAAGSITMRILDDPAFQERAKEMTRDGDAVSFISLFSGLCALLLLLLLTWWWKRGRIIGFIGLRPPALKPMAAWAGLFVVTITAIELIALLFPAFDNSFMESVLSTSTSLPLLVVGSAVMPALFEEFFLRGLLLGSLRHVMDKHTAIAIVSGLFTLMHLQYPWYLLLLYVLPLGVLLGYARANTGSIWTPVVLHLFNNTISLALPQLP